VGNGAERSSRTGRRTHRRPANSEVNITDKANIANDQKRSRTAKDGFRQYRFHRQKTIASVTRKGACRAEF